MSADPVTAPPLPSCAVIIPTYNGAGLVTTCLEALLAHPPANCRWTLVVVDDASTDGTQLALEPFASDIVFVRQEVNTGFSGACNAGARAAGESDYLVFLNNDTLPMRGWLDALIDEVSSDEDIAAVGAKLLYPGGQIQHAGLAIHQNGLPHHLYAGFDSGHPAVNHARDVVAATAACLLVRRVDFERLGGFDTAYHNAYEDLDLCFRLREQGRRIRYCPRSVVIHLESVTRFPRGVPEGTEISDRVYEERWRGRIPPDDVQHYLEDGLLEFEWGTHYPLTLSVAPELAVVKRDDEELTGMERLLAERSWQVLELASAETRRLVKSGAAPRGGRLRSARPGAVSVREVIRGREHRLGTDPGERMVSVLIPVKDGGPYLRELLPAVLGQSISARVEIVAMDSGSNDDSLNVLEQFGAHVYAIPPAAFDHGLTRNLLAERAQGELLVFLTQRALPSDDRWLAPLVRTLESDPEVAGVCSRLIARSDADLLTRLDVARDLNGLPHPERKFIYDWTAYSEMGAEERRRFLNFHTVSAAIRAEALRRTPFRSVRTLGEDLLWAREVVESGWALVHEPSSVARHSHAYSLRQLLARNVDDGVANRDIVERTFPEEEIVARIHQNVADDIYHLREQLGLSGAELEQWHTAAVLRRTAQVIGQWIGVNYETLPEELTPWLSGVAQARVENPQANGGSVSEASTLTD
jgi:GT2 family glycosyltransferase